MGPRYQVVMGSTPDPVPDLISLSQAGSRFDFELPPKASEMQVALFDGRARRFKRSVVCDHSCSKHVE
eukprot:COSAG02_NODE_557_length_20379_cov_6.688215_5_plen_68_part_00